MNIKKQINKIWLKNIFKSYLWLIFPIALLGGISSCETYIEAGTHLTKASVSVRGYYRKDGTYIRSYHRRPPGGVIHDEPYESKRSMMEFLFFISLVGGCGSIIYYIGMSKDDVNKIIRENEKEQERKRMENKKGQVIKILSSINFDYRTLRKFPFGLSVNGVSANCKFCHCNLYNEHYYISYNAIKYTHYICANCLTKIDSLGRGQTINKYAEAIKYIAFFNQQLEIFLKSFLIESETSGINFTRDEIKSIFINNIKLTSN